MSVSLEALVLLHHGFSERGLTGRLISAGELIMQAAVLIEIESSFQVRNRFPRLA